MHGADGILPTVLRASMSAVLGFYKFIDIDDADSLARAMRDWGAELGLTGTVLLAAEGVNGSVAGEDGALRQWMLRLRRIPELSDINFAQTAAGDHRPFYKFKVKCRREIIPLCDGTVCPPGDESGYLDAGAWNDLMNDELALIIDVRNAFEYRVGRFDGAVDAGLDSFSSFADRLNQGQWDSRRRVGMYCTGGIRCEKAAALWQAVSGAEVYQLKGGIIGYLQTVPEQDNRWHGECFVFDQRVSLDRRLQPGSYTLCFGCGEPLSPTECTDGRYCYGLSCPYCHGKRSERAVAASRERLRQIELARLRPPPARSSLVDHCAQHGVAHDR